MNKTITLTAAQIRVLIDALSTWRQQLEDDIEFGDSFGELDAEQLRQSQASLAEMEAVMSQLGF